jgi:sulfur-oxidizing protein SoxY
MMGVAAAVALPPALEAHGRAAVEAIAPILGEVTRGAPVASGKVRLEVPPLADNGNLVPLKVTVESPMSENDHVRSIVLVAEKNPRPLLARFFLGPLAGRAAVTTRIRLAGSQRVIAIAAMSDGSFWSDVAEVTVTLAACIEDV